MTSFGRRSDAPPAPKPYALIELPEQPHIDRAAPIGHDALRDDLLTGRLDLELEALSPLHVASGLLVLTNDARQPLVRELVRVGGVPVLPGSSLKGGVRAIVEAISPSCIRATRAREAPDALEGCRDKDRLCAACRLFGAPDYQGLLRFGDMRLTDDPQRSVMVVDVPQFFRPRTHEATYLKGRYVRGLLRYYQTPGALERPSLFGDVEQPPPIAPEPKPLAAPKPPTISAVGDIFTGKVLQVDESAVVVEIPGFTAEQAIGVIKAEALGGRRYRVDNTARAEVIEVRTLKSGRTVVGLQPAARKEQA